MGGVSATLLNASEYHTRNRRRMYRSNATYKAPQP